MATTSSAAESESEFRSKVNQRLIESGEKEALKDMLRAKLVEIGWKDRVKSEIKNSISRKGGNCSVDEIVAEVTPFARSSVPDNVKNELHSRIEKFINDYFGDSV
jgi:hypothetical protein